MTLGDAIGRLNRLQQGRAFKIAASVAVLAVLVAAIFTYSVQSAKARQDLPLLEVREPTAEEATEAAKGLTAEQAAAQAAIDKAQKASALATVKTVNSILERRMSVVDFGVGGTLAAALALVVIWLGLAITYLAVVVVGLATALPMWLWGSPWWRGVGVFVAGSLALASSFTALVQVVRIALSGSHPVLSIARNVVNEAVRMKVSLVFIVLLVFGLAALPGVLDPNSPLRYRVQAFLTYGMEGTFLIVAVLTVFLACATVSFEQRDKIIWQTMTKPVRAWQYVLGKWLGVGGVSLVLMGVSASGIYLFTEYLRNQPAQGESQPFVSQGSLSGGDPISMDRLVLETQVLTAREAVRPLLPPMVPEELAKELARRAERAKQSEPDWQDTDAARRKIRDDFDKELVGAFFAVTPGMWREYVFPGMLFARERGVPITLRFKADAGNNSPLETYRLSFLVGGQQPIVREVRLGQFISLPLSPATVETASNDSGDRTGFLRVQVFNGDWGRQTMNKETVTFNPSGGLEVSFPVDTFRANFLRVAAVSWLKLLFLASVGLMLGTFLSFPVAALSAFGVLICAEGVPYLREALESYGPEGYDRAYLWWRVPIIWVSESVTFALSFYARINPSENIATGRFVGWSALLRAVVMFGGLSAIVLAFGSAIFRRRELATYSGH